MPRTKPPRTVEKGLWAKPTVLNNVETFANIPYIINEGANAYRAIGNAASPAPRPLRLRETSATPVSSRYRWERRCARSFSISAAASRTERNSKAVQIGGPSGGCLTEEHLDLLLDYDSLKHVGAIMGSGGLVVMDEDTCMAEVARFFMKFTQKESCGSASPAARVRSACSKRLSASSATREAKRISSFSRSFPTRSPTPRSAVWVRAPASPCSLRCATSAGLRAPRARQVLPALQRQAQGIAD